MGCQKEIAAAIRARDADYVLALKDNQPAMHQAVYEAFVAYADADFTEPSLRQLRTVERGHGRYQHGRDHERQIPARGRRTWWPKRGL